MSEKDLAHSNKPPTSDTASPWAVVVAVDDIGRQKPALAGKTISGLIAGLHKDGIPVGAVASQNAVRALVADNPCDDWDAEFEANRVDPESPALRPCPAPDVFLEAARRFGLPPWRLVAWTSPTGPAAASARAAGCQTFAIVADERTESRRTAEKPPIADDSTAGDSSGDAGVDVIRSLSSRLTASVLHATFFSCKATLYADVALNLPVPHTYTYRVPEPLREDARPGALVRAPVRGRETVGVITRTGLHTRAPKRRLKPIEKVLSPEYAITPDLLALGRWLAQYYLCGPGEALSAISFFGLHDEKPRTERQLRLSQAERWTAAPLEDHTALAARDLPALTPRQAQVVRFFVEGLNEPLTRAEIAKREGCSASVVDNLLAKGVLEEFHSTVERGDGYGGCDAGFDDDALGARTTPTFELNAEQADALTAILTALEPPRFETFLLYGITGSGKTEVYLRALARTLADGRQAIVLVPEISLTPQAVQRFRSRFGPQIGVYHSQLSAGQKYDLWRRIEAGEVRVLIGARSAVFAPFEDLGLVIVDEEHEHSYKQSDPAPRYHARDVALWRARFHNVPAILGSATPSLETLHNARCSRYRMLHLSRRAGGASLPEVRLIDMGAQVRDERRTGLISEPLEDAIRERLAKGQQVILFLNRRGFSNFLLCMSCRTPVKCDHCDVVMTWHKARRRLICHFCGDTKPLPDKCPECGAPSPAPMGAGTQRIEEDVQNLFPDARVLRVDLDTTRGRHGFLRLWERIESGDADILLGTQMIAKGLHLERVTLVGVISADHALFLPDFRSAERAFALMTQVAGRAGRMAERGLVLVQTFVPHHYAIQRAVAHDVEGFWKQELHMREMLKFPPHWRLLRILLNGEDAEKVARRAARLGAVLRDRRERSTAFRDVDVLGPNPAPIERIQDRVRHQVLLRGRAPSRMRALLQQALAIMDRDKGRSGVMLTLDMDPMDLL